MASARAVPHLSVDGWLDQAALGRLASDLARLALPRWLPAQRWFGQKARAIQAVDLVDYAVVIHSASVYLLSVVDLTLDDATRVTYFVPLAATLDPNDDAELVATVTDGATVRSVYDATRVPDFRAWLLDQLTAGDTVRTAAGNLTWLVTPAIEEYDAVAQLGESRVGSAEQSNTSLIFGDAIIVKVFRRLDDGINPDIELGRYLTVDTAFRHMPLLLADCRYAANGQEASIALAQVFVPSVGDGWSYFLECVLRAAESPDHNLEALLDRGSDDAALLGVRTADMHLALASATREPALVPEEITPNDVERWTRHCREAIQETVSLLDAVRVSGETQELCDAFRTMAPSLTGRVAGFESLTGLTKTRIHGDYHLGQTLRTLTNDFVIIDFEGEPQRPLRERREKVSPLKDVAGMLRSFNYVRGAVERSGAGQGSGTLAADLVSWERAVRRTFLDAYFRTAAAAGATFLPATGEDFRSALAAWELDKALYEVRYEINNRPDWLALPLSAILKLV